MLIKKVENIDLIQKVHEQIYLNSFPIKNFESKREKGYQLLNYEFWENDKIVGYCIVIDKIKEKNLHAWVGGIIPEFQARGYFSKFYDWLIEYGENKKYKNITGNTDNYKFNILRMMIKKGFYIYSTNKGDYGDGIKIYLQYDIYEKRSIRLSLTPKCNLNCFFCHHEGIQSSNEKRMSIPEIERLLSQARRLCINEITLTGGEPLLELDKIIFILKYCGSWDKPPVIKIVTNGVLLTKEIIEKLKYKGSLLINLSIHSIENTGRILGKEILKEHYKNIIEEILKNNLSLRVNSLILKDINNRQDDLINLITFISELGVKKINLMELLVTKQQQNLHQYYMSNKEIEDILKVTILKMGKYKIIVNNEKKIKYRVFIENKELEISIYRLSCRCGCKSCYKNNDITINSEGKGFPCYLESSVSVGNAVESLENLINKCDLFTKNKEDSYSKNLLYWGCHE